MIFVRERTLELLASQFGILGKGPDYGTPRTEAEVLAADADAEAVDERRAATLREQRRRLWGVIHRLPTDEQIIIQGISAGQTHEQIAEQLGITRVTVTERLPTIINRIRFWLGLADLPDDEELQAHLIGCGLSEKVSRRVSAYLAGESLRDIAKAEERHHVVVMRSIDRGMERVRGRGKKCGVSKAVAKAYDQRRNYRPPTASTKHIEAPQHIEAPR